MATPTLTLINAGSGTLTDGLVGTNADAESATGWTDFGTLDPDIKVEGSNSISGIGRANNEDMYYDNGGAAITAAGKVFRAWFNTVNVAYMGTLAGANPYELLFHDSTTTTRRAMLGSDTYEGGWVYVVQDMDLVTTGNGWSANVTLANVDRWGWTTGHDSNAKNVINCWTDAYRYMDGYALTGGTSGDKVTIADVFTADMGGATPKAYGIVQRSRGIYFGTGTLQIGNGATTTYFSMDGEVLQFINTLGYLQISAGLYTISATGSGCDCVITGSVIRGPGIDATKRVYFDFSDTNHTLTFTDNLIVDGGTVQFASGQTATGNTFDDCLQITHGGADMDNCTVKNYNGTAGTAALLYNVNADPDGEMDGMTFIKGTATCHAIELGSNTPSSITLRDIVFTGYNGSDGQNDSTIYNNSGKAITITLAGSGSGSITYRNGSGASTTVISNVVTTKVIAQTQEGTKVENARVLFWADSGGDLPANESVTIANSGVDTSTTAPMLAGSIELNGLGDNVQRTTFLPSHTQFTVSGWAKRVTDRNNYETVFLLWEGSTDYLMLGWNSDGSKWGLEVPTLSMAAFDTQPAAGDWFYWAVVGDAEYLTAYWFNAEGVLQGETRHTNHSSLTPSNMYLGSHANTDKELYGKLAQVRVWNRSLTANEIYAEIFRKDPVRTANLNCAFGTNPQQDVSGNNRPWAVTGVIFDTDAPPVYSVFGDNSADTYAYRDTDLPTSTAITMAAWVYSDAATGDIQHVFSIHDSAGNNGLQVFSDWSVPNWKLGDENGNTQIATGVTRENWYYVAATCAGTGATDAKGYAFDSEGTLLGTATRTGLSYTPWRMAVANIAGGNLDPLEGKMRDFRCWNAVLTPEELQEEALSVTPFRTANLNCAFESDPTKDISGNNRPFKTTDIDLLVEPLTPKSVRLNSANHIVKRTANLPSMTSFTWAGWVRLDGDSGNTYQTLAILRNAGDTVARAIFVHNSFNDIRAVATGDTQQLLANTDTYYGQWLYIAMTCSGTAAGNFKAYAWNSAGELVGSSTNSSVISTDTATLTEALNNSVYTNETGNGLVSHVRVWDAVLSQTELESELASQVPIRFTNLNTAWAVDPHTDLSSNNRPWTVIGAKDSELDVFSSGLTALGTLDQPGDAIAATSSNDLITRTANLPSSAAFTVSGWFNVKAFTASSWQMIFSFSDGTQGRWIEIDGSPKRLGLNTTGAEWDITGDYTSYLGDWVYIAMTSSGDAIGNLTGYIWDSSGTLIASQSNTTALTAMSAATLLDIGTHTTSGSEYSNAHISQVRLWDSTLTQTQLEAEMLSPTPVITTNLNTAWDEGDPTTDVSGNSRPFTVTRCKPVTPFEQKESVWVPTSSSIITRSADVPGSQSAAMSCWVKVSLRSVHKQHVIALADADGSPWIGIYLGSGDNVTVGATGATAGVVYNATPDSEWIYVAWSSNGTGASALSGYCWDANGELLGSVTTDEADSFTAAQIEVGNNNVGGGQNWCNGKFAHVRVWNTPVTEAEFEKEMFSVTPVKTTGLVTAWADDPTTDISGNSRPFTVTDCATVTSTEQGDSLLVNADTDVMERTANLPSMTAYTIAGWAKLDSTSDAVSVVSTLIDVAATDYRNVRLFDTGSNQALQIFYSVSGGGQADNIIADYTSYFGSWVYVAITSAGNAIGDTKGYCWDANGKLLGSVTSTVAATSTTSAYMEVGNISNHYTTRGAWGNYAHWRVWDAALTEDELVKEMVSYNPVRTTNANTAFRTDSEDVTGNNNNWTHTGTTTPDGVVPFSDQGPLPQTVPLGSVRGVDSPDGFYRNANLPSATNFTIAGWVRWHSDEAIDNEIIFALGDTTGGSVIDVLFRNWSSFRLNTGTVTDSSFNPVMNKWYYVALQCQGTGSTDAKCHLFDESGYIETITEQGITFTPNRMEIMRWNGGGGFSGNLADVRVWDAILTLDELKKELTTSTPVRTTNLNCAFDHHPAEEDLSGNSRVWTEEGTGIVYESRYPNPQGYSLVGNSGSPAVPKRYLYLDSGNTELRRTANLPAVQSNTIAMWVRRRQNAGTSPDWEYLWALTDATPNQYRIERQVSSGDLSWYNSVWFTPPGGINWNEWLYLVVATDATNSKAYFYDSTGTLVYSNTQTAPTTFTPTELTIGDSYRHYRQEFPGDFAHVRIWDVALTQEEIEKELYSDVPVKTTSLNCAFDYRPDVDLSGNGRTWIRSTLPKSNVISPQARASVELSASGDKVERTEDLPDDQSFTIAGWSQHKTGQTGVIRSLVALQQSTTSFIAVEWSDLNQFRIRKTGPAYQSITVDPGNAWFYWALTSNGTTVTFRWWTAAGSKLPDTTTAAPTNFTPDSLMIGNNSGGAWLSSYHSHVRVWNSVLTQTQLEAEMRADAPILTTNLNTAWDKGNPKIDLSGNNREWTPGSTTATVTHTAHGMATGDKVLIKGGTVPDNEGVYTITSTGANSYTYTIADGAFGDPIGDIRSTWVIISGLTNSVGEISANRSYNNDQPVKGWARKSAAGALRIDSGTDLIQRTSNLPDEQSFTMAGWFRLDGDTGNTWQVIGILIDSGDTHWRIIRWHDTGTGFDIEVAGAGGSTGIVYADIDTHYGQWLYIAMTGAGIASGDVKAYLWNSDGELLGTASVGAGMSAFTPGNMEVGNIGAFYTNEYAQGSFSQWRVWDAVLTQTELTLERQSGTPVRTANLNTAFIDSSTDVSGNSRNWTVTGTTFDSASRKIKPHYKTALVSGTIDTASGLTTVALMLSDE